METPTPSLDEVLIKVQTDREKDLVELAYQLGYSDGLKAILSKIQKLEEELCAT